MSEKVAGTSYILNFYRDVILLTHHIANYMNLILEIEFKYSSFELSKLDVAEKQLIIENIQMVRYYANKCYIEYKSLRSKINFEEGDDKAIEKLNAKFNEGANFVMKREDVEAYATLMNGLLINEVVQHVLETSQDLMQQLFGDENATQQGSAGQPSQSYPV